MSRVPPEPQLPPRHDPDSFAPARWLDSGWGFPRRGVRRCSRALSQVIAAHSLPLDRWQEVSLHETLLKSPPRSGRFLVLGVFHALATVPAHLLAARAVKVRSCHLERKAVVYVGRSIEPPPPQQVIEAQDESKGKRQYALSRRGPLLSSWPRDRRRSHRRGSRGWQRVGLQETSRPPVPPRPNSDWITSASSWDWRASRLARSGTRIWAYSGGPVVVNVNHSTPSCATMMACMSPTDSNDRLLLGLKGIMSRSAGRAGAQNLRSRMNEGRLNKARRGELFAYASIGYVRVAWSRAGKLDPDEKGAGLQWCDLYSEPIRSPGEFCVGCSAIWCIMPSACRCDPMHGPNRLRHAGSGIAPTARRC